MNKVFFTSLLLLMAVLPLQAQANAEDTSSERPSKPIFVGLQGSALMSVNENVFTYTDNKRVSDLLTGQVGLQLGFYFTNRISMRLAGYVGKNASACNSLQTAGQGFYPYKFKSTNVFLDVAVDFFSRGDRAPRHSFYPRLYAGVGYAHTYDFTDSGHPWQKVSTSNSEFGGRAGFIGEFAVSRMTSFYFDLCAEGYGDMYNGLQPSEADQRERQGYAGLPLDLRFVASLGLMFHF